MKFSLGRRHGCTLEMDALQSAAANAHEVDAITNLIAGASYDGGYALEFQPFWVQACSLPLPAA